MAKINVVFGTDYSSIYDNFYKTHNYDLDVNTIKALVSTHLPTTSNLLDFGCGTGEHLSRLSDSYNTVGVDLSLGMLERAKLKYPNLELIHGDVKSVNVGRIFDVVTMNSAVLCYQLTNNDLLDTLKNVRRHLSTGGLFIFDVWYGPTVLSVGPTIRMIRDNNCFRIVNPILDVENNLCTCEYTWFVDCKEHFESHTIRYFFKKEIELLLNITNFELIDMFSAGTLVHIDKSNPSWHVSFVSRAK